MTPLVYVSGPITTGNTVENIRRGLEAGSALIDKRFCVIVPHEKCLGMEIHYPRSYAAWLGYDLQCIDHCQAVFRLEGESKGGDVETEYAVTHGIPVYRDMAALLIDRAAGRLNKVPR